MRRTRTRAKEVQNAVNRYVQEGKTYKEAAELLDLGSPQLARYHFLRYRKLSKAEK